MRNHYAEILDALAAASVNFVVAGGVAVVLHGVERMTMDIDVAVDMHKQNLRRFIGVMQELGMRPRVPVPAEFLMDPRNVERMVHEKHAIVFTFVDPNNPLKQVDLFLAPDHSYGDLLQDSVQMVLHDHIIHVASIRKLIELKGRIDPPRSKDLHDIAELRKLMVSQDETA